jgi:hypothetical protein
MALVCAVREGRISVGKKGVSKTKEFSRVYQKRAGAAEELQLPGPKSRTDPDVGAGASFPDFEQKFAKDAK